MLGMYVVSRALKPRRYSWRVASPTRPLSSNVISKPSVQSAHLHCHTTRARRLGQSLIPRVDRVYSTEGNQPEWPSLEERLDHYREGGYHSVKIGDKFNDGRYEVVRKLGWGRYSTIWLAKEEEDDRYVSLKILTAEWTDRTDVLDEVKFLQQVTAADPDHPGFRHVLTLLDQFHHKGPHGTHICLVTEVLGEDLTKMRKQFDKGRFPVNMVKQLAKEVLLGLDYLHRTCNITHTDMKADNVLVAIEDPRYSDGENYRDTFIESCLKAVPPQSDSVKTESGELVTLCKSQPVPIFAMRKQTAGKPMRINVKIIDLGVANWNDHHWATFIQCPAVRAPEVILRAEWDTSVDIWSLGCIIFELLTGEWLFVPRKGPNYSPEHDHLAQMASILEPFPEDLLAAGKETAKYFDPGGHLPSTDHPERGTLEQQLDKYEILDAAEFAQCVSFLRAMLRLRPQDRAQACDLLEHPWLREATLKHWWSWP